MMENYVVWRQLNFVGEWVRTSYIVTARTDKEAQSKVKRKFAGCGLSDMSLLAVPEEQIPQHYLSKL